jgi:hypothetical protein
MVRAARGVVGDAQSCRRNRLLPGLHTGRRPTASKTLPFQPRACTDPISYSIQNPSGIAMEDVSVKPRIPS